MKKFIVQAPCIGIDLGLKYSRVAIVKNEKPEVIANAQGAHSTPSVVAFNENETLVGEVAYNFGTKNPANTVFDAKRFLGRNQEDEVLASEAKRWRFKIMYKDQKPMFQVPFNGSPTNFSSEQICGQIFANLKSTAEAYMHTNVRNAVLCCPAHFTAHQREELIHAAGQSESRRIPQSETLDAASANLSVLLVISKPVAAAIAYDLDKNDSGQQTILVFSMGARSCEVVVLDVNTGCFQERCVQVDHLLGGDAIDDVLVDWFVDQFKRKHKLDPSESHRSIFKIRSGCESAKRQLSQMASTRVEVESAHEGLDFSQNLSRAKFEEMISSVLARIGSLIQNALAAANVSTQNINKVVMVGGCSRIPKVQSLVQQAFPDVEVCLSIPPDEAGVLGTAIQGNALVGSSWSTVEANSSHVEISALPKTIWLGTPEKKNAYRALAKGTSLPCDSVIKLDLETASQSSALIQVYEESCDGVDGEEVLVASLALEGVEQGPVYLHVQVDSEGLLTLNAKDSTGTARHGLTFGPLEDSNAA